MYQRLVLTSSWYWYLYKNLPKHDTGIITSSSVASAPREAFLVKSKILGHRQERVRQALLEGFLMLLLQVCGLDPHEPLVEIDINRPARTQDPNDKHILEKLK